MHKYLEKYVTKTDIINMKSEKFWISEILFSFNRFTKETPNTDVSLWILSQNNIKIPQTFWETEAREHDFTQFFEITLTLIATPEKSYQKMRITNHNTHGCRHIILNKL